MTVNVEKLARMAEQIATNVTISDDTDEIAQRLADHLRRFWDPRMRAALVASADDLDLSKPVRAAARLL